MIWRWLAPILAGVAGSLAFSLLAAGRAADGRGLQARLERRAEELGEPLRIPVALQWGAAIAAGLAIALIAGRPILAVPIVFLTWQAPRWWMAGRVSSRERLVRDEFGTAVQAIAEAVRSGLRIEAAIDVVGRDSTFAASMLRETSRRIAGGVSLGQALAPLRDRLRLDCVTLFVSVVLMCGRVGGSMAEALDSVTLTVRDRQAAERGADVQTASGRQQVRMLAAAPALFLLMMSGLFPDGVAALFTWRIGQIVLVAAGATVYLGVVIGKRIVEQVNGEGSP